MGTCFVLEGGAMRGNFSGGVLDYMTEHGFPRADCVIGTSAGTLAGIGYVASQPGRPVRINTTYCTNWRFLSLRSWLATGNAFGTRFYFDEICHKLDPLDFDALENSTVRFVACATDLNTGNAYYHDVRYPKDLAYMQASAAMPYLNKTVEVDGRELVDGGTADSIPYKWALEEGFERVVVVLTQDRAYVKGPQGMMGLLRRRYRKYPAFIEALESRQARYNECRRELFEMEREGNVVVLAPERPVTVKRMEHEPGKIMELYNEGRKVAQKNWDRLLEYVGR